MYVKKVFINKYSSGKLQGFANVIFSNREDAKGGIRIDGFKIFNGDKGLWVDFPSTQTVKEGKVEYFPIFKFTKDDEDAADWQKSVADRIIAAYKAESGEKKTPKGDTKPSKKAPTKQQQPDDDDDDPEW